MKILIQTTALEWESWGRKLLACRGGVGLTKNLKNLTIDLEPFGGDVEVVEGMVDRAWFNTLTLGARERGYSAVVLHMDRTYANMKGIRHTIRGAAINDEDLGEMYVIADENDKVVYTSGRRVDRFVKVFLHEMSHWMAKTLNQEDKTHYWDYERENIMLVMSSYEWPMGIWDRIVNALRKERMVTPLEKWTVRDITQGFLVPNTMYASGVHAGVDFGVPTGTILRAPTDGKVTYVWKNSRTLGNACLFEFYHNGKLYTIRCAHLKDTPKKGGYRRGDTIALTGNTGRSTGPHLHIELWKGGYNYDDLLSETSVRERLINPYIFFASFV
jgi:hypothetical protein